MNTLTLASRSRILTAIAILFAWATAARGGQPNWTVDPARYQYTSTIAGTLLLNDTATGGDNIVAAFVNGQVRGVSTPVRIASQWIYFLNVYSNSSDSEMVEFLVYDAGRNRIVAIEETHRFVADEVAGSIMSPFVWHAYMGFDHPPVLSGIPNQSIKAGSAFTTFRLRSYLWERDGDTVQYTVVPPAHFTVTIDAAGAAAVRPVSPSWIGSENIVFIATDVTSHSLNGADTATFTVTPANIAQVNQGWNLVSLPVGIAPARKSELFPTAIGPAFRYEQFHYAVEETLALGWAYWMKFPSRMDIPLAGSFQPVMRLTVALDSGWNMIGGLADTILTTRIAHDPGMALSPFWGYEGQYVPSDRLVPGKGYWVKADRNGSVILTVNEQ